MKCRKCGTELVDGARYCIECGTEVIRELVCTKCHTKLPLTAKFCYTCGVPVNKTEEAEPDQKKKFYEQIKMVTNDILDKNPSYKELILNDGEEDTLIYKFIAETLYPLIKEPINNSENMKSLSRMLEKLIKKDIILCIYPKKSNTYGIKEKSGRNGAGYNQNRYYNVRKRGFFNHEDDEYSPEISLEEVKTAMLTSGDLTVMVGGDRYVIENGVGSYVLDENGIWFEKDDEIFYRNVVDHCTRKMFPEETKKIKSEKDYLGISSLEIISDKLVIHYMGNLHQTGYMEHADILMDMGEEWNDIYEADLREISIPVPEQYLKGRKTKGS